MSKKKGLTTISERRAEARFVGLAGSLVKQKILTEDEAMAIRADHETWNNSLTALVRLANIRLAQRGSKGDPKRFHKGKDRRGRS